MFERFIEAKRNRAGKQLSPRTVSDYQDLTKKHLGSITKLKLSQITPDRLRSLKIESDAQNNRARAVVSSVFNWATEEGITGAPNPATAIKNRFIKSRERFLQPDEFPRFFEAVEQSRLRDFWLLLLFTGARKSNVMAMRWQDVNLEEGVWLIPETKNGEPHRVPLSPEAVEILRKRRLQRVVGMAWVFPAASKSGHMETPTKAWGEVLEKAGISESLRIHDLRRTLGSWQARNGSSLTIIGKSLGHKSQQATQIYSRLDLDPVRSSVEAATAAMLKAGKGK